MKTKNEFNEQGLRIHFLDYESLKFKVNDLQRNIEKTVHTLRPHLPRILFEIGITQKGWSGIYKKLMNCDYNIVQNVKQKWEEVLNDDMTYLTV